MILLFYNQIDNDNKYYSSKLLYLTNYYVIKLLFKYNIVTAVRINLVICFYYLDTV